MKTVRFITVLIIPLLFACAPRKPEIPMTEVPAGPLLHALEQRRQSFTGLKAMASIQIRTWGRKRTLESVGIVLDGQRRLRMEAYGPLGQTMMAVVWDGRKLLTSSPDSTTGEQQGQTALDQLFGEGQDVRELCAALSGNVLEPGAFSDAVQFCGQNRDCVLEIRSPQDRVRRIHVVYPEPGSTREPRLVFQEVIRAGTLVYTAQFDRMELVSQYLIPMKIEIENPGNRLQLAIEYSDVEVNVPIDDAAFTLTEEKAGGGTR